MEAVNAAAFFLCAAPGGEDVRPNINKGKDGRIIEDLAKEELPAELQRQLFEILNPTVKTGNKNGNKKA